MPALAPFPGAAFFHKGQRSPVINAMGKRLVAEGCGKYRTGPGPEWTEVDQQSYAAWQRKLRFEGADANGIPGKTSWDRLRVPTATPTPPGERVASPVPGHGVTTPHRKKGPHWSLGYHTGADYAAPEGKPCVAVRSGSIVRSGHDGSFGRFLVLRTGGFDFWYCHLSEQTVNGGSVRAGQKIGEVGSTGNATGPHLHFEKRPAGGGFGSDVPPTW
ncbi:peptidoglycan-binding protein [Streptomyces europaeiscabiei]|uniref:peptidoglycan-binding protein n=1 Tax=Streptomyces europaeiscabiei TaxID=146819 RepID=UPI0038D3E1F1